MKIFSRWLFKGFHAWEHRLPAAKDILLLKATQDLYARVSDSKPISPLASLSLNTMTSLYVYISFQNYSFLNVRFLNLLLAVNAKLHVIPAFIVILKNLLLSFRYLILLLQYSLLI